MGIIRKTRGENQEDSIPAENVWIEDPAGTGQHILVKKSDLDERGFLKDQGDEDATT